MTFSSPGPAGAPQDGGTPAAGGPTQVQLAVEGMHCDSCVALIEEILLEQPGVSSASVDLGAARAAVGYDPSVIDVDGLRSVVEEAGYPATPVS